jgi:integral membrane protein
VSPDLKTPLALYRVMATVVGVLLIVLCLVGLPLNEAHLLNDAWFPEGTTAQQLGDNISKYLGVAHGWLYMGFLFVAFWLSRRANWDLRFTLVTLVCGTIPIASFWAEHRATARVRAEYGAAAEQCA